VRHRDDVKLSIENTVDFVALKIQALHVAVDVIIRCGVTKAQIAIMLGQIFQMLQYLRQMLSRHRDDRHQCAFSFPQLLL
jgi:hypothetical protein